MSYILYSSISHCGSASPTLHADLPPNNWKFTATLFPISHFTQGSPPSYLRSSRHKSEYPINVQESSIADHSTCQSISQGMYLYQESKTAQQKMAQRPRNQSSILPSRSAKWLETWHKLTLELFSLRTSVTCLVLSCSNQVNLTQYEPSARVS